MKGKRICLIVVVAFVMVFNVIVGASDGNADLLGVRFEVDF